VKKGEPVFHIYLLFILCVVVWGGWKTFSYIKELEETVHIQNEAIELQQEQLKIMELYLRSVELPPIPRNQKLYLH
jgi:hypothetical protein